MKLSKDDIMKIRERAINLHQEMPYEMHWSDKRDEINPRHFQAIAYVQALAGVLNLDIEVETYRADGKIYTKR
jgi:hypothetical protein